MKTIDILYIRYFDLKGEVMTLGGIQTYISQLTKLALKIGFQVRIFQYSDISFEKVIFDNAKVIGIPIPKNKIKLFVQKSSFFTRPESRIYNPFRNR